MASGNPQAAFDPYYKWLGIPPTEQPPHHYRLLGIPLYETDADVIETAADRQMTFLRQCATGPNGDLSQKLLNEVSEAQVCLLVPNEKAAYDKQLKAELGAQAAKTGASQVDDAELVPIEDEKQRAAPKAPASKVADKRDGDDAKKQRAKLEDAKTKIEGLLADSEIERAVELLYSVAAVKSAKFAQYASWARDQLKVYDVDAEEMRERASEVFKLAQSLIKKNDYEQSIRLLEEIPETFRTTNFTHLLTMATERQEEVDVLLADIDQAADDEMDDLLPTIERLLELKPGHRKGRDLYKQITGRNVGAKKKRKSGGKALPFWLRISGGGGGLAPAFLKDPKALIKPIAAIAVLGAIAWGGMSVMDYFGTPSVKFNIAEQLLADEGVTYFVDGEQVTPEQLQSMKLAPGDHELVIKRGDQEIYKKNFNVSEGGEAEVAVAMADDGKISSTVVIKLTQDDLKLSDGNPGEVLKFVQVEIKDKDGNKSKRQPRWYGQSVKFTPSGRYLVSGLSDGTIRLWDVESGKEIRKIPVGYSVTSIDVSPGGKTIVANGDRGPVFKLWNLEDGNEVRKFEGHTGTIASVQFAPDGKSILSTGGQNDGSVRLWNAESGKQLWSYALNGRGAAHASFSSAAKSVLASVDGIPMLLDAETGKRIRMLDAAAPVLFAPQGNLILCRSLNNSLPQLWNPQTGLALREFDKLPQIHAAEFSPDGKFVAMTQYTRDKSPLIVWDVNSGKEAARFECQSQIMSLTFSPDGRFVVSGNQDTTLTLWRLPSLKPAAAAAPAPPKAKTVAAGEAGELRAIRYGGTAPVVSADGKIAAGLHGSCGKVWDLASGELLAKTFAHDPSVLAMSYDGRYIATANRYAILLWDVATSKELNHFTFPGFSIRSLSFPADSRRLLATVQAKMYGPQGVSILFDVLTGGELKRFPASGDGSVQRGEISTDGKFVATADDEMIRLYDAATGEELHQLQGHEVSKQSNNIDVSIRFTADGKQLLSWGADRSVRLWDIVTGEEQANVTQAGGIRGAGVSADGKYVLVNSTGLRLLDTVGSRNSQPFATDTQYVNSIRVAPGREIAVAGGSDYVLRVWRVPSLRESSANVAVAVEDIKPLDLTDSSLGKISQFASHELGGVRDVTFLAAGDDVLSISPNDKFIRLWNTTTGGERLTLETDFPGVYAFAISPDNKTVYGGSANGDILEVSIGSQKKARWSEKHPGALTSMALSQDGSLMVSTGIPSQNVTDSGACVCLWDVKAGKINWTYKLHNRSAGSAAISQDGKLVMAVVDDIITLIDAETGKRIRIFDGQKVAALSPDARYIVAGDTNTLRLWDAATGLEVRQFRGTGEIPTDVAFSPNGKFIASVGSGVPNIRVWDVATGRQVLQFKGRSNPKVTTVAFSADGGSIGFGQTDGKVGVWKLPPLTPGTEAVTPTIDVSAGLPDGPVGEVLRLSLPGGTPGIPVVSADGKFVACTHAGAGKVWNLRTRELVFKMVDPYGMYAVSLTADGSVVATSSRTQVGIWDVATGEQKMTIKTTEGPRAAISANGELLIISVNTGDKKNNTKKCIIYSLKDGKEKELHRIDVGGASGYPVMPQFSPDESLVAIANGGRVGVYDVATGEAKQTIKLDEKQSVSRVAFSLDGTRLYATAVRSGKLFQWNVADGQEVSKVDTRSEATSILPNGQYVVPSYAALTFFDSTSAEEVHKFESRFGRYTYTALVPGGKHFVTTGDDGTLRVWRLPTAAQ